MIRCGRVPRERGVEAAGAVEVVTPFDGSAAAPCRRCRSSRRRRFRCSRIRAHVIASSPASRRPSADSPSMARVTARRSHGCRDSRPDAIRLDDNRSGSSASPSRAALASYARSRPLSSVRRSSRPCASSSSCTDALQRGLDASLQLPQRGRIGRGHRAAALRAAPARRRWAPAAGRSARSARRAHGVCAARCPASRKRVQAHGRWRRPPRANSPAAQRVSASSRPQPALDLAPPSSESGSVMLRPPTDR